VVLVASIPGLGYPDTDLLVELVPEVWMTVCHAMYKVTIALESGVS